jgi:hypothetical protein
MLRRYVLVRPVIGFWKDTCATVKIPAGALLDLFVLAEPVGVCDACWGERELFVFREDVDRNGLTLER